MSYKQGQRPKIIDKVENILKTQPACRDSDKRLLLAYWQMQGWGLSERQMQAFMRCTAAETITRARRELKVRYPATEQVDNQRFNKYRQMKNDRAIGWWQD